MRHVRRAAGAARAWYQLRLMTDDAPEFSLDRGGVAMIAALGFVLAPALLLGSVFKLGTDFDLGQISVVEWVLIAVTVGLCGLVVRLTARELRWAVGVELDDAGISRGSLRLGWDEIERLEAPRFGILVLAAGAKQLPLRTYLFRNRKALLEHIARKTGKTVPEMAYSY